MIHGLDTLIEKNIDPEVIHCIKLLSQLDGHAQYSDELQALVDKLLETNAKAEVTQAIKDLYNKVHKSILPKFIVWAATKLIFMISVALFIPFGFVSSPLFIGTSIRNQLKHNWQERSKKQTAKGSYADFKEQVKLKALTDRHKSGKFTLLESLIIRAQYYGNPLYDLFKNIPSSIALAIVLSLACAYAYSRQVTRLLKGKCFALRGFLTERLRVISQDDNSYQMGDNISDQDLEDFLRSFRTLDDEPEALDTSKDFEINARFHTIYAGWLPKNPLKGHLGNHGQTIIEVTQDGKRFYRYYDDAQAAVIKQYEQEVLKKPAVIELGTPTYASKAKLNEILDELDNEQKELTVKDISRAELLTLLRHHFHLQQRYDMRYFPDVWGNAFSEEQKAAKGTYADFRRYVFCNIERDIISLEEKTLTETDTSSDSQNPNKANRPYSLKGFYQHVQNVTKNVTKPKKPKPKLSIEQRKAELERQRSGEVTKYKYSGYKYISKYFFPGFFDCIYYQSILAAPLLDIANRPTSSDLSQKCLRARKGPDILLDGMLQGLPTDLGPTTA